MPSLENSLGIDDISIYVSAEEAVVLWNYTLISNSNVHFICRFSGLLAC